MLLLPPCDLSYSVFPLAIVSLLDQQDGVPCVPQYELSEIFQLLFASNLHKFLIQIFFRISGTLYLRVSPVIGCYQPKVN